jgi:hypothetical protein
MPDDTVAERIRLAQSKARQKHWKRWGPYLAERAWGTVREDYSANGDAWNYLTHDQARSRSYRWTEDGILGICDNHQYLCFALAFWNGKDPILKERLFGLTGPQGNHGEDVKEVYYYLDATPTNSYLKGLYKYPQAAFPYSQLVAENAKRTRLQPEFELHETGVFDGSRYFDVFVEYAKQDVDDILIRIEIVNRGPETASLTFLPTLWFRNIWDWCKDFNQATRPLLSKSLSKSSDDTLSAVHSQLGSFTLQLDGKPQILFTENETNTQRIWGWTGKNSYYKDAFNDYIVDGTQAAVNPQNEGTKACAVYRLELAPGKQTTFRFRLSRDGQADLAREYWDEVFATRLKEADEFYLCLCGDLGPEARQVQRQAFAGLFWSKQYYHYVVDTWLKGDDTMPPPPPERLLGRNRKWRTLFNEDVISMPDKWEYPWYAAWDLAFHMVAIAPADPDFAKAQLSLFLREWYMHPNGQIPAYEWNFSDVNPPVHAWAAWRVFKIDWRIKGEPDRPFLESVYHKLLLNFTWWINRKDSEEKNIFEGGFLGLDNIGVFDRNATLPSGWVLEQSDGTSWMAMYCVMMLEMALFLAEAEPMYADIASKFFEHFLYIADAINHHAGDGLWNEEDGFYYDRLLDSKGDSIGLKLRSMVGLVPLFAVEALDPAALSRHPGFRRRMEWFIKNRPDLISGVASMTETGMGKRRLLSLVNPDRLKRILQRLFDESEFLSPYGLRSLSRYYADHPYEIQLDGRTHRVAYEPADSQTDMFGGNSNWRGPIWFPMNFLIIEALQRFDFYYGDSITVEFPSGSGQKLRLAEIARQLSRRLGNLFLPRKDGSRAIYGDDKVFQDDPNFQPYVLFFEYFDGDSGKGLGASHQTGWTGLVAKLMQQSGATGHS